MCKPCCGAETEATGVTLSSDSRKKASVSASGECLSLLFKAVQILQSDCLENIKTFVKRFSRQKSLELNTVGHKIMATARTEAEVFSDHLT